MRQLKSHDSFIMPLATWVALFTFFSILLADIVRLVSTMHIKSVLSQDTMGHYFYARENKYPEDLLRSIASQLLQVYLNGT